MIVIHTIVNQLERFRDWAFRKEVMHIGIIFVGQFLGQGLFAYMNINVINGIADPSSLPGMKIIYTSIFYSCDLFINISFGRQFAGGVFNPAVVFFRVFRRTDRLKFSTACIYWAGQFTGATCGCLVAYFVCDLHYTSIMAPLPLNQQMLQCGCQLLGTFILTFMGQYGIEKKMTFVSHNKELYVWLPLLYMIARGYSAISNGVNPGFGFGYQFGWCLKFNRWDIFYLTYILVIPPFIGAVIGAACFQLVLRPFFPIKQQELQTLLSEFQKHSNENPNRATIARMTKFHRVTIGDATKQNDIQLPISLAEYYDFGMLQDYRQLDQQIDSIGSDEQDDDDFFMKTSGEKMLEDVIARALEPSVLSSLSSQKQ